MRSPEEQDPFEQLHGVEEEAIQEGFAAGERDGLLAGLQEGRELGLQKGYEIGAELGFYAGCVRTWRALQQVHHNNSAGQPPAIKEPIPGAHQGSHEGLSVRSSKDVSSLQGISQAPAEGSQEQLQTGGQAGAHASSAAGIPEPPPQQQPFSSTSSSATPSAAAAAAASPPSSPAAAAAAAPSSATSGPLFSERSERSMAQLEELIASFPLDNPQDERLHDLLERIRGRFKALAATLGVLQDYMPGEGSRGPDGTLLGAEPAGEDQAAGRVVDSRSPLAAVPAGADLSF